MEAIHPWLALGVVLSTAATDAVYVMFSAAVASRRRVPAATWSSVWYLLSAFAVISYTRNWVYVCFAAVGSWIGRIPLHELSAAWLCRGGREETRIVAVTPQTRTVTLQTRCAREDAASIFQKCFLYE